MSRKPKVLVVCTGNSMRSQLGEAVLRAELGDRIDVYSAGTHPSRVYPVVIDVLNDVGIDAREHYSKSVRDFLDEPIDLVITVCDHAREVCPYMPNARKTVHCGYPDPMRLVNGDDEYEVFADLRDQMRKELTEVVRNELGLY